MRIAANRSVTVRVNYENASGLPVKVQGEVTWESTNDSVANVEAKVNDSLQATITAGPSAGTAKITATADADLGDGEREVESTLSVEVVARGEAVGGEITLVRSDQACRASRTARIRGCRANPRVPTTACRASPRGRITACRRLARRRARIRGCYRAGSRTKACPGQLSPSM